MQTRHHTPNPNRHRTALAYALGVAILAAFAAPGEAQLDPLTVSAVDPDAAPSGGPVAIYGTGFGPSPDALLCWADTGDGGVLFEIEAAADDRIDALVGPAPSSGTGSATGAVKVWRGKRYALADRVVLSQGRLLAASEGEVFVGGAVAVGPDFTVLGASPGTAGSVAVREELRLDLEDLDPGGGGGPQRVRVTAVIETSGDSGTGNSGLMAPPPSNPLALRAGKAAGPAWAATLTIEADAAPPTPEALAAGLAEVLEAQLGSLGLTARAEGTDLVVGHTRGIRAGFVNLVDLTRP
jgi:hypothetical protein